MPNIKETRGIIVTSFITALYFAGLLLMAFDDWRYQSVPAPLCDGWLVAVGSATLINCPVNLLYATAFSCGLGLFAWFSHGLGSADVIILAGTTCVFGVMTALVTLLIATLCGILFAVCTNARRIAFILHLFIGTCLALCVQMWL